MGQFEFILFFPSSDWKCKEGRNKFYQGEGGSERPHDLCKAGNKS